MSKAGLFDSYLHASQPHAVWKRLHGTDADGDVPSPRGGHAMCIDPVNDTIYLFGGWDGQKSLDDFWMYSVKDNKWRVLSHGTSEEQNAPGARSCHKMVFDTKTGSIYLLGRLSDSDSLKPTNDGSSSRQQTQPSTEDTSNSAAGAFYSEFYRYHTRGVDAGKWDFLSFDTAVSLLLYAPWADIYVTGSRHMALLLFSTTRWSLTATVRSCMCLEGELSTGTGML